ncbi:two-component system C4-dicarboxylate transport response regulator DctD [Defluviimonas denitrificans]|jgi:two-component system C4-dicarboxylate transport response regulator DctD|uniref:Two-component system C4-dicarboxylate transport response regulator DctD n=1 Tax=Albidovulum denitrificans TaxID=404881 RepID=A0A2S8S8A4_9RHOB|nr:sigma-54 dependent transcriptional regulator [Defluviimonas denitrificans]PQV57061.1 two-component system C4-dicarboxylate transport response regulator DctD [Defluviimonas denitrificans]
MSIDRVLLVDDDRAVREALGQSLELAGMRPLLAGSYIEAKDHIAAEFEGVVLSDIRMPGKDGFALLDLARKVDPDLPVILLTGEGDVPTAVRGMTGGAFDFLEKPCNPSELIAVVTKALRTRALILENRALKREIRRGDAAARMLVGSSAASEQMREAARMAARTSAEVLISGPPGAGTAKMAEVIHLLSAAAMRPFQKLSAASATPDGLAMLFEKSGGGTIFLDEVAALPMAAQFALLDLIDSHSGTRVIAGTYRDLARDAAEGRFNPDLFYKLDVMRVRIPPLKERTEDIPVLFRHYVAIACEQSDLPMPEITPDVIAGLMAQDWPGNARGLMNAAMRFAMGLHEAQEDTGAPGLSAQMARVERTLLIEELTRRNGNATEAAAALKLPRKTFYDKLARHGIRAEDYRE